MRPLRIAERRIIVGFTSVCESSECLHDNAAISVVLVAEWNTIQTGSSYASREVAMENANASKTN